MNPAPDELLLEERLPWYVNGSLGPEERAWVDQMLARSPAEGARLERERALARTVVSGAAVAAQDIGLERVRAAIRQSREKPATASRKGATGRWDWLFSPRLAVAMAAVIVVQGAGIAWLSTRGTTADDGLRSVPVTDMRTLRVRFVPGATEERIRTALQAAGARIVGGPNLVGEYWLASPMTSVEEMRSSLQASGLVGSMEADPLGPH